MRAGEAREVAALLRQYLINPFADPGVPAEAEHAASHWSSRAAELVRALIDDGAGGDGRRAAIALAYHDHLAGTAPGEDWMPADVFAAIKLPRITIDRVSAAAARCRRALDRLCGTSPAIAEVRASTWAACFGESVYQALRLQPFIRDQNVLVRGETGTGKELIAAAIAAGAPEPSPTVALNAAAIPAPLLESELFGHVRGAFTGATESREGAIARASGGTLFLDEIADLDLALQPKLLRVLETDQVVAVGADRGRAVDVRYVTASSQPLEDMVERGQFRRDLYQRLAGVTITVPPLRERREDLRPIADAVFERFAARMGEGAVGAVGDSSTSHLSRLAILQARFRKWLEGPEAAARPWHGNVRELESEIRTRLLGAGETGGHGGRTPSSNDGADAVATVPAELRRFVDATATLREVEDWYVLHVLASQRYSQRKAARVLGIDRGTLARRLRRIDSERG